MTPFHTLFLRSFVFFGQAFILIPNSESFEKLAVKYIDKSNTNEPLEPPVK